MTGSGDAALTPGDAAYLEMVIRNPRSRLWRDDETGAVLVGLNDLFAPAADAEEIPPQEISIVLDAWRQRGWWGILGWVLRRRYGAGVAHERPGGPAGVADYEKLLRTALHKALPAVRAIVGIAGLATEEHLKGKSHIIQADADYWEAVEVEIEAALALEARSPEPKTPIELHKEFMKRRIEQQAERGARSPEGEPL